MKKYLLLTLVVALTSLMANTAIAQGVFDFKNATNQNYSYRLIAAEDWCGAVNVTGQMGLPPMFVTSFTAPLAWTGAWKAIILYDQCNIAYVVEHPQQCFFGAPTLVTFTDCTGFVVTLEWLDEHTGVIY